MDVRVTWKKVRPWVRAQTILFINSSNHPLSFLSTHYRFLRQAHRLSGWRSVPVHTAFVFGMVCYQQDRFLEHLQEPASVYVQEMNVYFRSQLLEKCSTLTRYFHQSDTLASSSREHHTVHDLCGVSLTRVSQIDWDIHSLERRFGPWVFVRRWSL